MNIPVSHFHSWERFSESELAVMLGEFAEYGLRLISLNSGTCARLSEEAGLPGAAAKGVPECRGWAGSQLPRSAHAGVGA